MRTRNGGFYVCESTAWVSERKWEGHLLLTVVRVRWQRKVLLLNGLAVARKRIPFELTKNENEVHRDGGGKAREVTQPRKIGLGAVTHDVDASLGIVIRDNEHNHQNRIFLDRIKVEPQPIHIWYLSGTDLGTCVYKKPPLTMNIIFPDIDQLCTSDAPLAPAELADLLRAGTAPPFSRDQSSRYIQGLQHNTKLLQRCIQHLRGQEAAHHRDIARYKSLHAPVRKLPPEILRRIFDFACAEDHLPEHDWKCPTTAFCLSSVCNRWREITLRSPELWARLSLVLNEAAIHRTRLAISRSQQHPLSLRLIGMICEGPAAIGLFRFLVEHAARWVYVNLGDLAPYFISALPTFGDTPLLESVVCKTWRAGGFCERLSHHPRLRHVTYQFDGIFDDHRDADYLPWEMIRHLELEYDWVESLPLSLETLGLGVSLHSAVYRCEAILPNHSPYSTLPDAEPLDPVISELSMLTARLHGAKGFHDLLHDFFQGLTLPRLTNLIIVCEEQDDDQVPYLPRSAISECIIRSGCDLTALVLEGICVREHELVALLKVTPSLHAFTFCERRTSACRVPFPVHKTVTTSFIKRLEAPLLDPNTFSSQFPLLTKLTCLKLVVQSHFDSDQGFVEMVKSRWDRPYGNTYSYPTERLRTVVLHVVNRTLVEESYESLKMTDKEGMMVTVVGGGIRVV
ncbi:hypothetical protein V5O48_006107 [Marasmius crinis-equi]|uniref:F-box domain-containing protein n=1 Tax=Marasmius crinis-equi TaxID=585013 RepID=A0ABR3FKD2_9AGAR